MQHYKGELGEFDYDENEFTLTTLYGDVCLRYKGLELKGENINIPKGITNCNYMFKNTKIYTPPKIPEGVINTTEMFGGCKHLHIKKHYTIPNSVVYGDSMFMYCSKLKTAPLFPKKMRSLDNITTDTLIGSCCVLPLACIGYLESIFKFMYILE